MVECILPSDDVRPQPDVAGRPRRIGIIGLGRMGSFHAAAYRRLGAVIAAGTDPNAQSRAAFEDEYGAPTFASTSEMLANTDLDIVSICSPPRSHPDDVIETLDAGLHVLCEKPLAVDIDSARRVQRAADEAPGQIFMVAFFNRFFEPVRTLVEEHRRADNDLGGLRALHIRFNLGNQEPRPWQYDRTVAGGGAIMNNLVHAIDLFRYFAGEPERAVALTRTDPRFSADLESDAYAMLLGIDGVVGVLETCSWSAQRSFNLRAEFERAVATVTWSPPSLTIERTGQPPQYMEMQVKDPLSRIEDSIRYFLGGIEAKKTLHPNQLDAVRAIEIAGGLYDSVAGGTFVNTQSA